MRLFLSFLRYGDLQAAERLFPEMIFYISYGLLLYLCDRLRQKKVAGYRMLLPFGWNRLYFQPIRAAIPSRH